MCFECQGKGRVLAKADAAAWKEFSRHFVNETRGTKAYRVKAAFINCSLETQNLLRERFNAATQEVAS
jgi:hypothetical protein